MYCTGIGKAVLAELEQREIEFLLEGQKRESFTPHTLTVKDDIIRELEEIRQRGYAIDNEEVELGLKCVASAIYDYQGKPAAAISISSSAVRMTEEQIEKASQKLKRAAGDISRKLGYRSSAE